MSLPPQGLELSGPVIDVWGEVVAEVSAPDEAHIAANTPQGCTALAGRATEPLGPTP